MGGLNSNGIADKIEKKEVKKKQRLAEKSMESEELEGLEKKLKRIEKALGRCFGSPGSAVDMDLAKG